MDEVGGRKFISPCFEVKKIVARVTAGHNCPYRANSTQLDTLKTRGQ